MGSEKSPGFLTKKDRSEGETRNRHAEGDQWNGPEVRRGDAHEEEGGSPDRREGKEDESVGDAHVGELI